MDNLYTIKNFRVFDETGVSVPIKPLTILTGCNSSGKSSIVKSLVLLNGFLYDLKEHFPGRYVNVIDAKLDFTNKTNVSLGSFNRVLNNKTDSKQLEFGYVTHSYNMGEDLKVKLVFGADENDELNEGYLQRFEISNMNDEIIYSSGKDSSSVNLSAIIKNFYRFVYGEDLVTFIQEYQMNKYLHVLSENEEADYKQMISLYKSDFIKRFGEESLHDINVYKKKSRLHSMIEMFGVDNEIMAKGEEAETLFYLPILDILADATRLDIESKLLPENCNIAEMDRKVLEYVVCDFCNSDFATFGEYYRFKEKEFLSMKNDEDGPRFFNANSLDFRYGIWYDGGDPVIECLPQDDVRIMTVHLGMVYYALTVLEEQAGTDNKPYYVKGKEFKDSITICPKIFEMFKAYAETSLDFIAALKLQNISYVSSSIVDVKRLYSLESGDSFTKLLKNYFNAKRVYLNKKDSKDLFKPGAFMNKWIQKFGVGHAIEMSTNKDKQGVTIRIFQDENDKTGTLLAEQGYGITQLFVILLRIETVIMEAKTEVIAKDKSFLGDASYLSDEETQLIRHATTLAIEEPEVHQHPKFQSMLAELFVDALSNYNVHFIIETHSEYLIRKLQLLVARKTIMPSDISVLYVYDEKNRPGYEPHVKRINIREDGMLDGNFGEGFFDEADMLSMFLLTAGGMEND